MPTITPKFVPLPAVLDAEPQGRLCDPMPGLRVTDPA